MLVFRDGRQVVNGPWLINEFTASLRRLSSISIPSCSSIIDALLRTGELECVLADQRVPAAATMAELTDALAAALVSGEAVSGNELEGRIRNLPVSETLTISRPEGFAYYALHPLDFAELAASLPVRSARLGVIGIRSIGTTLSAVVAAAKRNQGVPSERITVRPEGHPWDRRLDLGPAERAWVGRQNGGHADFWVVDEGPGLSGSSFLAVGEALLKAGVPRERVTFLGSALPNLASLRAPDAAARWVRFRSCFTRPLKRSPTDAAISICGGEWRRKFMNGSEWPAVWPQFERPKFLSGDSEGLFKFEGLGRFGAEVRERSARMADAGFGPQLCEEEDGYARYGIVDGRVPTVADAPDLLEQIAEYCAWRARIFAAEPPLTDELEHMIRTNAREGLGEDVELPELRVERPVIADGRMHPYEWRLTPQGRLIKLDAASHGDDHFFPGPTDIAWDLAGAIIEWRMGHSATEFLLENYRKMSGDDCRARLPGFILAYTLFRLGYCSMAAESLRGTDEEVSFQKELKRYRAIAWEQVQKRCESRRA